MFRDFFQVPFFWRAFSKTDEKFSKGKLFRNFGKPARKLDRNQSENQSEKMSERRGQFPFGLFGVKISDTR